MFLGWWVRPNRSWMLISLKTKYEKNIKKVWSEILLEGRRFTIFISHGLKMVQSSVITIYVSVFFFIYFTLSLKFLTIVYAQKKLCKILLICGYISPSKMGKFSPEILGWCIIHYNFIPDCTGKEVYYLV